MHCGCFSSKARKMCRDRLAPDRTENRASSLKIKCSKSLTGVTEPYFNRHLSEACDCSTLEVDMDDLRVPLSGTLTLYANRMNRKSQLVTIPNYFLFCHRKVRRHEDHRTLD